MNKLIESIILISTFGASSIFNAIMTKIKCNKAITKIKTKYQKQGYIIDDDRMNRLFFHDLNMLPIEGKKEVLDQKVLETISLFPIFNIIGNVHNIEYLMGNYENNKVFENIEEKISTDYLVEKGFIEVNNDKNTEDITDEIFSDITTKALDIVGQSINEEIKCINKEDGYSYDNSFVVNKKDTLELLNRKKELLEAIIEYNECALVSDIEIKSEQANILRYCNLKKDTVNEDN